MDHYWSNTDRRKESLAKSINSNNPCNLQSRVHRKSQNNSLEIQKKQSKREIRKKTSVKKSNKVSETRTQSKLSMNRKNPSIRKYAVNQKSEMSIQENQASYPEINVVKQTVTTKGPWGLRNLGNTCYINQIFHCLAEGASLLRRSPKQFVKKEGRNLQRQVLALLKFVHSTEGKVIDPVQARHVSKLSCHNLLITQDAHEFLMASLLVLQLLRYQGSVSSVMQCKVVNTSLSRKKSF